MSKRVLSESVLKALRHAYLNVPSGFWMHKRSKVIYNVLLIKVLDENTCQPMVLYNKKENEPFIIWARKESDFLQNFELVEKKT